MLNITPYESNIPIESDSFGFDAKKSLSNYSGTTKDSYFSLPEYENLYQTKISKKTNRGRKENFSLPKNKLQCEICLEYSDFSKEPLIFCSICKCHFHKYCYSQYEIISSSSSDSSVLYKCIRCLQAEKLNKNINDKDFNCFICGHSDKTLNYNPLNRIYFHKICLCFLPELNTLTGEEICREKMKKWRFKNSCKYCGKKLSKLVGVIKCKKPKCKDFYHVPCAIRKGMIFDLNFMKQYYNVPTNEQIPFYCSNHNKKIANQYKHFIMEKIKNEEEETEKSSEKNEKLKTFFNNEESLISKQFEENYFENREIYENIEKDYDQFFDENKTSMSLSEEDEKIEEYKEAEKNNDNISESNGEEEIEEKFNCKNLDNSLCKNVFYLDFETALKENEMNDGDFSSTIQLGNLYNQNINNIDEFCLNKKSGLRMNRQNSYYFLSLDT